MSVAMPLVAPAPSLGLEPRALEVVDSIGGRDRRVLTRGRRITVAVMLVSVAAMMAAGVEAYFEIRAVLQGGALVRAIALTLLEATAIALLFTHLAYEIARYGFLRRQDAAPESTPPPAALTHAAKSATDH